ncbi:hypothetical protein [Thermococcus sp.]|uniref:hypothetical protein n=1 Tax=Thermococcus sp. TaxID=35749 RepID=UPI0025E48195|nr:hypothetical protein [Thermococcus sp.]
MALAIARKLGNTNPAIGRAVGEALSMWLSRGGYPDIKRNKDEFVELLAKSLQERGMYVDDNVKKTIREALEKATKIADKLIPDVSSVKHLDATSRAIANDAEDPFQILRNAGIDIEPELEEFREFLAEISGKRAKPKEAAETHHSFIPSEVLAIAKALEYAGFSTSALKRAEEDLIRRLDVLLENLEDNALEIAYTAKLLRLVQRKEVEKIREFAR